MTQSTSPACKKKPCEKATDKYPIKRGFVGYFFYYAGVIGTHILIRYRRQGKENIPKNIPYVIAANHQTYVDGLWIAHGLPHKHFRAMCCLAASDLETSHGKLGRAIMRVGRGIAVDRFGSPVRGLIKAKKEIEKGHVMLVHPEGTRTQTGRLAELKDGASYMSVKARVPLLPVYIEGGYWIYSRHDKRPMPWDKKAHRRKLVTVHFGQPLRPEDFEFNAKKMTVALSDWMHQMEKKAYASDDGATSI